MSFFVFVAIAVFFSLVGWLIGRTLETVPLRVENDRLLEQLGHCLAGSAGVETFDAAVQAKVDADVSFLDMLDGVGHPTVAGVPVAGLADDYAWPQLKVVTDHTVLNRARFEDQAMNLGNEDRHPPYYGD